MVTAALNKFRGEIGFLFGADCLDSGAMNLACADERQYSIIPAEESDQFQITLRRKQYRFSFGRQVDNCSRCRIY
jgi:hypothetical protein